MIERSIVSNAGGKSSKANRDTLPLLSQGNANKIRNVQVE